MFGKNPRLAQDKTDGAHLHVVKGSPFLTIQGEGPYAGWPAVFLRLHGCHLACTFCDTQFSDPDDPHIGVEALVQMCLDEMMKTPSKRPLLVITGGEPLRQNLGPFLLAFDAAAEEKWPLGDGPMVQIETAGHFWQPVLDHIGGLGVVISPKTGYIHPELASRAIAFKYIVSASDQFDPESGLPTTIRQNVGEAPERSGLYHPKDRFGRVPIYLSPMDEYDEAKNKANKAKVAELAIRLGCYAAVQLHKELGVP